MIKWCHWSRESQLTYSSCATYVNYFYVRSLFSLWDKLRLRSFFHSRGRLCLVLFINPLTRLKRVAAPAGSAFIWPRLIAFVHTEHNVSPIYWKSCTAKVEMEVQRKTIHLSGFIRILLVDHHGCQCICKQKSWLSPSVTFDAFFFQLKEYKTNIKLLFNVLLFFIQLLSV